MVSLVEVVEGVGNRLQFQADAAECSDEVEALDRKRNVPKHEQVLSQPVKVFEIEYRGTIIASLTYHSQVFML